MRSFSPGEECKVTLSFKMTEIASFDTKTAESVLEAGDYVLRLGTSSRDTKPCAVLRMEERAYGREAYSRWRRTWL